MLERLEELRKEVKHSKPSPHVPLLSLILKSGS
jgi:hypothetical protein